MPIITSEQVTPRESLMHDWELEDWQRRAAHDLTVNRLQLESKKLELKLKQEDATKARRHQQSMKELELAIRKEEVKWQNLLKIPLYIIKAPVAFLFGVAFIIAVIKGSEIDSRDYWKFLS